MQAGTKMMRHAARVVLLTFAAVSPCAAQHVEVGAAVAAAAPVARMLESSIRPIPVVRLAPSKGWGLAAGLNWYRLGVLQTDPTVRVSVRPLMAGVGYTFQHRGTFTTLSLVGGPAWNTLDANGASERAASVAIRPAISLSVPVARRLSATAFGGYLWNRPTFPRTPAASGSHTWVADALVVSGGLVFRVF